MSHAVRHARSALVLGLLWATAGCARPGAAPAPPQQGAGPAGLTPDSITVGLWRFDERGGVQVADAGPLRLEGTAGRATFTQFGRVGRARTFVPRIESFVLVPASPVLDDLEALTIEAWVRITGFGDYEDTPIAGRWSRDPHARSWLFSLGGRGRLRQRSTTAEDHSEVIPTGIPGALWFAFQPRAAGAPRGYSSTRRVEPGRWTHVAVTFDGAVVRFYMDGELDSQFASPGRLRSSSAPLLFGNAFDTRALTGFGGDLGPELADPAPYYAFVGLLDELRISSAARSEFSGSARR